MLTTILYGSHPPSPMTRWAFSLAICTQITSIEAMLTRNQLCWALYISRVEDYNQTKIVFYGRLSFEHCSRGAPRKRYRDFLKCSLNACGIDSLVIFGCWSCSLAEHSVQRSHYLWEHKDSQAGGEAQKVDGKRSSTNLRSCRHLQLGLPVNDGTHQPPWKTPLLISMCKAKPERESWDMPNAHFNAHLFVVLY